MTHTTATAAKKLGYTVQYVRELCITGRLKAVKVGRDWHITAAALQRYSEGRRGVGRPRKEKV